MNSKRVGRHTDEANSPIRIRWRDMTWRDYLRIGAGLFFFVLGVAGLVLPILQGVLFLIVSAILLAPYSRWVQKQLDRLEKRFPSMFERARGITRRWWGNKSADD